MANNCCRLCQEGLATIRVYRSDKRDLAIICRSSGIPTKNILHLALVEWVVKHAGHRTVIGKSLARDAADRYNKTHNRPKGAV